MFWVPKILLTQLRIATHATFNAVGLSSDWKQSHPGWLWLKTENGNSQERVFNPVRSAYKTHALEIIIHIFASVLSDKLGFWVSGHWLKIPEKWKEQKSSPKIKGRKKDSMFRFQVVLIFKYFKIVEFWQEKSVSTPLEGSADFLRKPKVSKLTIFEECLFAVSQVVNLDIRTLFSLLLIQKMRRRRNSGWNKLDWKS